MRELKSEGSQLRKDSNIMRFFSNFWREKESYNYDGVTFLILKPRLFLTAPFEIKRRKRYVLLLLCTFSNFFCQKCQKCQLSKNREISIRKLQLCRKNQTLEFFAPKIFFLNDFHIQIH